MTLLWQPISHHTTAACSPGQPAAGALSARSSGDSCVLSLPAGPLLVAATGEGSHRFLGASAAPLQATRTNHVAGATTSTVTRGAGHWSAPSELGVYVFHCMFGPCSAYVGAVRTGTAHTHQGPRAAVAAAAVAACCILVEPGALTAAGQRTRAIIPLWHSQGVCKVRDLATAPAGPTCAQCCGCGQLVP